MARRYSGPHRMTPARKAALRKAQLASARKRRRRGVIVGIGGIAITGAVVRHKVSGSHFNVSTVKTHSQQGKHFTDKGKRPGVRRLHIKGEHGTREGSLHGVKVASRKRVSTASYTHHKFERKKLMGQKTRNLAEFNTLKKGYVNRANVPDYIRTSKRAYSHGVKPKSRHDAINSEYIPLLGNYRRGQKGRQF